MMNTSFQTAKAATLLAVLASLGFTGCLSVPNADPFDQPPVMDSAELGGDDPSAGPNMGPKTKPIYKVTVFGATGPDEHIMPLEGTVFLQDALDETRAARWFGAMTVTIMRTPPDGGERHRIDINCGKQVDEKKNYAIRPGDHIIVRNSILKKDVITEITDAFMGRG